MNEAMDPLNQHPLDAKTVEVPAALIKALFNQEIDLGTFAFQLGVYQNEAIKSRVESDRVIGARHFRFATETETEAFAAGNVSSYLRGKMAVLHQTDDSEIADLIVDATEDLT